MLTLDADRHHSRPFFMRMVLARPRLLISILIGVLVACLIPESIAKRSVTSAIIGWNVGAALYILLALKMMFVSSSENMIHRARIHDEGKFVVLILVAIAAISSLGAIVVELGVVKNTSGYLKFAHIALAGATIANSWFFIHLMFALHYAHDYYMSLFQKTHGGLIFPGKDELGYSDFLYLACIIGTSGQTADVSFASKDMRRLGLAHCLLAYFFNTTILALTINIASGFI